MLRLLTPHCRYARLTVALACALLVALPLLPRGSALAHPLGNFTINRYARIELYSDAVHLDYVVDMAEIPTFQLIQDIDRDGDGLASQSELDAYAARERDTLADGFSLSLAGKKLDLLPAETSIQLLPGAGGLQVTRLVIVYTAPVVAARNHAAVTFTDSNFADRAGWKEVVVRASEGAQLTVEPRLTVDTSDALLHYPAETLKSAPDVREVAFTWTPGTGSPAPATATIQAAGDGRSAGGLSSLLHHDRSLGIIFLSLLAAFGFGALHALGPGHGKTVVAAYLVGSRGTARHALALGFTVTATHTSTVYLIGFITLSASAFIVPETLYLYLGVASGAMVVLMGASLFAGRLWRAWRRPAEASHRHGWFGRSHSHAAEAPHDHNVLKEDSEAQPVARATWRSLITLGVAGGLLPCPSAIVVMLAAISLGQVLFGMLLIVAFSLGLAGVLTAIGLALVVGKRISHRWQGVGRLDRRFFARAVSALPVLSALGITIAGIAITYQALSQPGL